MTAIVIGTLLLNHDAEADTNFVTVSYDANFMNLDVFERLYYVDRAVDELLSSTDDPFEDEEEDEDEDEEWNEEELA
jgi:hypothetical protein